MDLVDGVAARSTARPPHVVGVPRTHHEHGSLERIEVHRASEMITAALGVGPVDARQRLRAQAVLRGTTTDALALALEVVARRVLPDAPEWQEANRTRGHTR